MASVSGRESLSKSAVCVRHHERYASVTQGSKLVHAGGSPISRATKRGFKRGVEGKQFFPRGEVVWAWRKRRPTSSDNGRAFFFVTFPGIQLR